MLCRAEISLPDWPEGTMRDVDPKDERIQGYLRNAWVTPLVRQRVQATSPPEQPNPAAKHAKAG